MTRANEKVWQTTAMQNLVRYGPSGTYFARFRVGGKLVWKSLKTATFSVAKQRLPDTLRDHRSKLESFTAFADGKMTVADAAEVYLQKVRASVLLKPRSQDYRKMMIDFIRRSWPSLFATDVRKVTQRDCEIWLSRCHAWPRQFAARSKRGSIQDLRNPSIASRLRCGLPRQTSGILRGTEAPIVSAGPHPREARSGIVKARPGANRLIEDRSQRADAVVEDAGGVPPLVTS
jgi:hypothetical protein